MTLLLSSSLLRKGRGERHAELFSLGSIDRTCGNGSKPDQGTQRMGIRIHFSTQRVFKHWNRLPGEVINAPSLSVSKKHLNNILNNVL